MSASTAGSLVNVERLLDEAVTSLRGRSINQDELDRANAAREAVRLLLDVARTLVRDKGHWSIPPEDLRALLAFDASLAEEKS